MNILSKNDIVKTAFPLFAMIVVFFVFSGGEGSSSINEFSDQQICVAGIATAMGRNPSVISIESFQGGVSNLSYVRNEDGTRWKYQCKINGNKIIWAADGGRWRVGEYDSVLSFSVEGGVLRVSERYADGSGGYKEYTPGQLIIGK